MSFIADDRTAAIAMLEIVTSYRSEEGLRLDQAAAKSVQESPPTGDLALLDPWRSSPRAWEVASSVRCQRCS